MSTIADYITRSEVAKRLGVKERTVAEFVAQGKLKSKAKHRPPGRTGAPENLYDPADVEKLLQERANAKMTVNAPSVPLADVNGLVLIPPAPLATVPPPVPPPAPLALAGIAGPIAPLLAMEPLPPRQLLTLEEAELYTRLGKGFIKARVKGYPYGPHGAMLYKRTALDQLIEDLDKL